MFEKIVTYTYIAPCSADIPLGSMFFKIIHILSIRSFAASLSFHLNDFLTVSHNNAPVTKLDRSMSNQLPGAKGLAYKVFVSKVVSHYITFQRIYPYECIQDQI